VSRASRVAVAAALAVLLAGGSVAGAVPGVPTAVATSTVGDDGPEPALGNAGDDPAIVAVYPNPVADGDRGEFVVLDLPAGNYSLDDGEKRVALPNVTGRVAVTAAPALVRNLTDERVVGVPEFPALANGGERLRLRRGNATVATAQIGPAVELDLDSKRRPRGALHLRYQYRLFDESIEDIRLLVFPVGDSETVDDEITDRRRYKLIRRSMLKIPLGTLFEDDRIDGGGLNLLLVPVDESQLDSR